MPTKVYDETIRVMKTALERAKLGNEERLDAIRRMDAETRRLERFVSGPSRPAYIAEERLRSPEYGGRSVFGWEAGSEPGKVVAASGASIQSLD